VRFARIKLIFQRGSASSSRFPLVYHELSGHAPRHLALSPTLAQEDCARLRLERFSSVGRGPTWATEPSVQLDLESGTICQRISDNRIFSQSFQIMADIYLFGRWGQSAV